MMLQNNVEGVILAADIPTSRNSFNQHYYAMSTGNPVMLNGYIDIPFFQIKSLVGHVLTLDITFSNGSVAKLKEDELAFQFIHRYDPGSFLWFTCLQVCQIKQQGGTNIYDVVSFNELRFDVWNGNLLFDSTLNENEDFDVNYFSNIVYDINGLGNRIPLSSSTHVSSVIIPWKREIRRLAEHNFCYDHPSARLVIENRSYHIPGATVEWPHSILLYMWDEVFGDHLGLRNVNLGEFHNSAADIGGLCPPNCMTYVMPDLPTFIFSTR